MQQLDYWERLIELNLYSLERRRERYLIIYTWKVINGLSPNMSDINIAIQTRTSARRGLTCNIPSVQRTALQSIQTIKEESFLVNGPKLFNALPRYLRDFTGTLNSFKSKLDAFLKNIPNKPALPHYQQSAASNSLLDQLAQQRAEIF